MMIGLLIPVLVLMTILFLVAATVLTAKNKSEAKGGDIGMKTAYVYLVLFATLMMTIGGGVGVFMAAADLVAPSGYVQSYEEYKIMRENGKLGGGEQTLSAEELQKGYERAVEEQKQRMKDQAKNMLIKSLGWIVIPLPVFMMFQRRLRKE
jgi:hypothetical protein